MPNLSQTDICNLSLMRLGQRKIQAITDQSDPNAIACNVGWIQAVSSVSREAPWNCLKKRAFLGLLNPAINPQPTPYPPIPSTATTWAPGQNYVVNQYVIFIGYLYQCVIANTSSNSFASDLTKGYWFQTNFFSPSYIGPVPGNAGPLYEWTYGFQLPADFLLITELNGTWCWGGYSGYGGGGGGGGAGNTTGSLFEVYGKALYCNAATANIKYTALILDTTQYDPLFVDALVFKLASLIATDLRKDDSSVSMRMDGLYREAIGTARQKNAAESNPRRYNIVSQSRFVRSRRWSTNG